MTDRTEQEHIFVVDDEPSVCKVVGRTLEQAGLTVSCFGRAIDCIKRLHEQKCDLLITDVRMPGMDGMELLRDAKRVAPWLPIMLITGFGDIPLAVKAVKSGAADFIEKPLDKETFLRKVRSILQQSPYTDSWRGRRLTKAEISVLKLLVEGKSNKQAARLLGRSVRTVEDHRRNIMRKLDVNNAFDLFKRVADMGLIPPPPEWKRSIPY